MAEGYGSGGYTELACFSQIGMGSAYEVEYHSLLARDLPFIDSETYPKNQLQIVEVKRMPGALLVKVRSDR